MRHGSLFSGIGGFDLASEWMGWENVFHCEWNPFGQKVLKHYWPNAESFDDITKTDFTKYANQIDILTGGFPCQPFSLAGKRKGTDDERYLWGEMLRAIQEIKPQFVIAENVFGITSIDGGLVFQQVCLDLETEGYEVQPVVIPAAAKNAPHRRDRVWFVATNTNCDGFNQRNCKYEKQPSQGRVNAQRNIEPLHSTKSVIEHTDSIGQKRRMHENKHKTTIREQFSERNARSAGTTKWENFPTQSPICGGDDGIPTELDGITFPKWRNESIKAYGNAIVPQVAYEIFKAIERTI